MSTIDVRLADRSYQVVVEPGLRSQCGERLRQLVDFRPGRSVLLIADESVAETFAEDVAASIEEAGFGLAFGTVEADETNKSLPAFSALLEAAAREHIDRSSVVVAVGGGIVGDLAGFVAASWLRGIPLLHVPTTLLAMVDASIGGKTGVNLPLPDNTLGKNLVGAFWQPLGVLADPEVLSSLPRRELACGLAECVKHGMISDWSMLEQLAGIAPAILEAAVPECTELIRRSAAVKAAIVGHDEREETGAGQGAARAWLNLGHTFAHAIENVPELGLKHGEAVAIGLVAAGACARSLGSWTQSECDHLREVLLACELPVRLSSKLPAEDLVERMGWDKKVRDGTLTIVVPDGRGSVRLHEGPERGLLLEGWAEVGAS
ncbi:MAG: 3-dehydroquinate synthase [Planctomycetota bacterium]|nr:3-dehydroquinate synthase [Planctomycetota bacterium]